MKSHFDQEDTKLDELTENMERANQRVANPEQDARQPRLVMEADVPADTRLASARRVLLKQYKRCMGIAFI